MDKISIEKQFLFFSLFVGIIFSFLFPLYQTPDEIFHINAIYDELGYETDILETSDNYGDTYRIIRNSEEKVNKTEYFNFNKTINNNFKFNVKNIKISVIKHFPQAIGIIIGEIFDLPVIIITCLCEILAVFSYSFICYISLKILPIKKQSFIFIMLLPLCIQQMGSFSYDVILIPVCFLFISYILYLKFTKKNINLNDILLIFLLLFIIGFIKIPYILLVLLIMLLPLKKINIRIGKLNINKHFFIKNKIKIFSILIILLINILYFITKTYYGKILMANILFPFTSIKIVFLTIAKHGLGYIYSALSNFGWQDTQTSLVFPLIIILMGLFLSFCNYHKESNNYVNDKNCFKNWEKKYICFIFFIICYVIIISLMAWSYNYIKIPLNENWSVVEIGKFFRTNVNDILGVQGRYFIPILPLVFIIIFNSRITNIIIKSKMIKYKKLYYLLIFCWMFVIILNRYWIK